MRDESPVRQRVSSWLLPPGTTILAEHRSGMGNASRHSPPIKSSCRNAPRLIAVAISGNGRGYRYALQHITDMQEALFSCPRQAKAPSIWVARFASDSLPVTIGRYFRLAIVSEIGEAPRMQVTFWMPPLEAHCCFSMSARHVFLAAAISASLALHTSEMSATRSLRQVAMRPPPGLMVPQAFLISAAQAPRPDCAIAPRH